MPILSNGKIRPQTTSPGNLAKAEAPQCHTRPDRCRLLHRHLRQFPSSESLPDYHGDPCGLAAEEERGRRCRRGGGCDSLSPAFALDMAGGISIGEVDSPGAASSDVGSGATVGHVANGVGRLRSHARGIDHHRHPGYVDHLYGHQAARREMGPAKMSCRKLSDGLLGH